MWGRGGVGIGEGVGCKLITKIISISPWSSNESRKLLSVRGPLHPCPTFSPIPLHSYPHLPLSPLHPYPTHLPVPTSSLPHTSTPPLPHTFPYPHPTLTPLLPHSTPTPHLHLSLNLSSLTPNLNGNAV